MSKYCHGPSDEGGSAMAHKGLPIRKPHFGGLWKAAVRSMKTHLRKIVGYIKHTFEDLTTILAQIESYLNSRPLMAFYHSDPNSQKH